MEICSNCTASYLVDIGKIIEKIDFKDVIRSNLAIEAGKNTIEEEQLLKKHPTAKLVRMPGHSTIALISNNLQKIREVSLLVTKEKIRNSVKDDLLIIQTGSGLEELDKAINLLSTRLREGYEFYNPEFSRAVQDHESFINLILTKTKKELLKEINETNSMGAELKKKDLDAIMDLAKNIKSLFELKKTQIEYLDSLMKKECPNITEITGTTIGAKLISLAGSLERLSKFPASTIQLLGAEKALFRHLKNRNNRSPKFGILHEHEMVNSVSYRNKGKMARALGDKISIAAKVDFFKGKFIGKQLVEQLNKRRESLK